MVTIRSRKYDGRLHRSWEADLIDRDGSMLLFRGVFENDINHKQLGNIRRGTVSFEYYWLDRCYNVFRFHEPEGEFRNFYCNINMPPAFEDNTLDYIDLDIDVLVKPDFSYEVLDREEFEENLTKYQYPPETVRIARSTLVNLLNMIGSREFPFHIDYYHY